MFEVGDELRMQILKPSSFSIRSFELRERPDIMNEWDYETKVLVIVSHIITCNIIHQVIFTGKGKRDIDMKMGGELMQMWLVERGFWGLRIKRVNVRRATSIQFEPSGGSKEPPSAASSGVRGWRKNHECWPLNVWTTRGVCGPSQEQKWCSPHVSPVKWVHICQRHGGLGVVAGYIRSSVCWKKLATKSRMTKNKRGRVSQPRSGLLILETWGEISLSSEIAWKIYAWLICSMINLMHKVWDNRS